MFSSSFFSTISLRDNSKSVIIIYGVLGLEQNAFPKCHNIAKNSIFGKLLIQQILFIDVLKAFEWFEGAWRGPRVGVLECSAAFRLFTQNACRVTTREVRSQLDSWSSQETTSSFLTLGGHHKVPIFILSERSDAYLGSYFLSCANFTSCLRALGHYCCC